MAGGGYGTKGGSIPAIKGARAANDVKGARAAGAGPSHTPEEQRRAEERAVSDVGRWGHRGISLNSLRQNVASHRADARAAIAAIRDSRARRATAMEEQMASAERHGGPRAVEDVRRRFGNMAAGEARDLEALRSARRGGTDTLRLMREARASLEPRFRRVAEAERDAAIAAPKTFSPVRKRAVAAAQPAPKRVPQQNPATAKVRIQKGGTVAAAVTGDRRDAKTGLLETTRVNKPSLYSAGGLHITRGEGGKGLDLIEGRTGLAARRFDSEKEAVSYLRGAASGKTFGRYVAGMSAVRGSPEAKKASRAAEAVQRYNRIFAARNETASARGSGAMVAVGRPRFGVVGRVPSLASGGGLHVVRDTDLGLKGRGHSIISERTGKPLASGLSRDGATATVRGARSGKTTGRILAAQTGSARTWRTKRAEKALERLARINESRAARATRAAA